MRTIYLDVPRGLEHSIADAIKDSPIESGYERGVRSTGAAVVEWCGGSPTVLIAVFFPDPEPPRPTIPELIAKWLTEPTPRSRETLWESLISGGYEFEKGAFVFQGRYFSAKRPALNHLNEHLISTF